MDVRDVWRGLKDEPAKVSGCRGVEEGGVSEQHGAGWALKSNSALRKLRGRVVRPSVWLLWPHDCVRRKEGRGEEKGKGKGRERAEQEGGELGRRGEERARGKQKDEMLGYRAHFQTSLDSIS